MSDPNRLNRPSLKYSNYINEPTVATGTPGTEEGTYQLEKIGWVLFWLCFIPFFGGFFSLATIVIGIILLTRNRVYPGILFLVLGPIANAIITVAVFLLFFASMFGIAASQSFK